MTMRTAHLTPAPQIAAPVPGRAGFTLLEVLVSLGILVAGLASVAALLPASGSVLAEAGFADRSGVLAANGHADLRNRRLTTAAPFAGGAKMVVLGDVFPNSPFATAPFARHPGSGQVNYLLGDDLDLGPTNAPIVRDGGVCFGATIVPSGSTAPVVGSSARVSVAVFRKPGPEMKTLTLTGTTPGVFRVTGPATTVLEQDADRKRFLPGCSWVLALSNTASLAPRWLQVGSSWSTQAPGGATPTNAFVSFSDATAATDLVASGSTMTVYAFDGLLRVDERSAVLE